MVAQWYDLRIETRETRVRTVPRRRNWPSLAPFALVGARLAGYPAPAGPEAARTLRLLFCPGARVKALLGQLGT